MNRSQNLKLLSALVFSLMTIAPAANAGLITITLGNGEPIFSDSTPQILEILAAQTGQTGVFNGVHGNSVNDDPDLIGWLFNNGGAITDTIISASISIGLWDIDSSAAGDQLEAFTLDGFNFNTILNTMFEDSGGTSYEEFNVFTIDFDSSFFTNLTDGLLDVGLDIGGVGIKSDLSESPFNRYFLISSVLTIETEDFTEPDPDPEPEPTPVPEPSTLAIFALGMIGLASRRIKKQS